MHARCLLSYEQDDAVRKYYAQRRSFWPTLAGEGKHDASWFDANVLMTPRSWYEVSPFALARWSAALLSRPATASESRLRVAISAFSGVGVDCVALALQPGISFVVAIDNDPEALLALEANCRCYGVSEKVLILHADVYSPTTLEQIHMAAARACNSSPYSLVAHFSPPWGGDGYVHCAAIRGDVSPMCDGSKCLELAAAWSVSSGIIFLPRQVVWRSVQRSCEWKLTVVRHELRSGKCKGLSIVFGAAATC